MLVPAPVTPAIVSASPQQALHSARRTWRQKSPRNYTYRLQLSCYCTSDSVQPRTYVVRDRKPRHPPKGFKDVATMWRVFKLVQNAIDDKPDGFYAEYYPNGALKLLQVDSIKEAVDDEYSWSLDKFRRLH
jgi:transposase InsO family protein